MSGATAGGGARSGRGGRTKSGKPRPGTGGYGKRRLEGKGPTPPAEMRTGHPARRRAATTDSASKNSARKGSASREQDGYPAKGQQRSPRYSGGRSRGAGEAAEIVAGRNAVLESLRAFVPALALHVGPRLDTDERISEAITLAADQRIPIVEAGRSELDRLTGGAIHQGLALRIQPYSYAHPEDLIQDHPGLESAVKRTPLVVALDQITDPRNLGAIVRSVAAFGADGVVVPVRRSAGVTAGAWKASAGALARAPVARTPNLVRTLAAYAQAGLFVVGLAADGQTELADLALADRPLALVVGSEGRGLSKLVAQQCDLIVKIPIIGAESLNAAVAAGIALYQIRGLRAGAESA